MKNIHLPEPRWGELLGELACWPLASRGSSCICGAEDASLFFSLRLRGLHSAVEELPGENVFQESKGPEIAPNM